MRAKISMDVNVNYTGTSIYRGFTTFVRLLWLQSLNCTILGRLALENVGVGELDTPSVVWRRHSMDGRTGCSHKFRSSMELRVSAR